MFSKGRLGVVVLAVVVAVTTASCADWAVQGSRVNRVRKELPRLFQLGTSITEAKGVLDSQYSEYSAYSAEDCQRYSHSVPGYSAKGGPCIFGIVRVGSTWWGYQSAVEYILIFEPNGRLGEVVQWPVYTFL